MTTLSCTSPQSIPKERFPSETIRIFQGKSQEVWEAAVKLITQRGGKSILFEQESGLITFYLNTDQATNYFTLLIDSNKSIGKTKVIFRVWKNATAGDMGLSRHFFHDLEKFIQIQSSSLE